VLGQRRNSEPTGLLASLALLPNRCALTFPGSLRALAQYLAVEAQAWSALLHNVQTGASG
jgi:hypothetical protein